MPYKFNEARRHKIPKAKYRVTNWPEYDAALVRRGSLTVWLTEEAIAGWHAPATGRRGGQPVYSDLAIETGLALRLVFRLGLRQIEPATPASPPAHPRPVSPERTPDGTNPINLHTLNREQRSNAQGPAVGCQYVYFLILGPECRML
jgi:Transposase DDE domain